MLMGLGLGAPFALKQLVGSGGSPLNTSEFYAPLTHSLILTRGTGDPTYTRATAAWEFDNEGKLVTVPSGAARFGGARMVRNLAFASETFSGWTAVNNATVSNKAITFTQNNGRIYSAAALPAKAVLSCKAVLSASDAGKKFRFAYFDSVTGWVLSPDITIPSDGVVSHVFSESANPTLYAGFTAASDWSTSVTINIAASGGYVQIENVTGQSDTTASEYVSVGVLSAPFHGAGVDGVKYFSTNKDGSPISDASLLGYHAEGARTNSLLYSRDLATPSSTIKWLPSNAGSDVCVNGTFTADTDWVKGTGWTISGGVATHVTGTASTLDALVFPLAANTTYIVTYTIGELTASNVKLQLTNGATIIGQLRSSNGTYSEVITNTVASKLSFSCGATFDGSIDNVIIYKAAIQVTTCTGIDNAANSASTLTAGAANATILQTLTLASAARSSSAYVKARTLTPQVVGSELVVNGDFATDTVWTKGTGWTISGGVATHAGSSGSLQQNICVIGKINRITFTVVSGVINLVYAGASSYTGPFSAGTHTVHLVGTGTSLFIQTAGDAVLDNVSVKEVTNGVYMKRDLFGCTDITSQINSSTWTRVKIENSSVTNPSIGFLIATSGDAIDVDVVQDEAGAFASSPIITTTAAVTRNADLLTYAYTGNALTNVGTARFNVLQPSAVNGSIFALSGTGAPFAVASGNSISFYDDTNYFAKSGLTLSNANVVGLRWTGSAGALVANGGALTTGAFDGTLGITSVMLGALSNGNIPSFSYIKQTHIWQSALTDAQLQTVTTP